MTDFLFHKVSEKEKQKIKKQAKAIMQNFSKKLSDIDEKMSEPLIERDERERKEGNGEKCNEEFRNIMFENAPNKNENFIIAERKRW